METIFQRVDKRIEPNAKTKVLKAEDREIYLKASEIIASAKAKADLIIQDAEKIYEKRKAEGYQDGIIEAKMEHAENVIQTVGESVTFIENIEKTIIEVVTDSIRKVLNSCSKEELIEEVVRKALTNMRSHQRILLRVCPQDEATVKQALAAMLNKDGTGFIDVLVDSRLERTSCILESELGIIDASLEVQLSALERAFKEKISQ